MQNQEKNIKQRKDITALWIDHIKNERYTFAKRKYYYGHKRKLVYEVTHSLDPYLEYINILNDVIWCLNYEWHKLIGRRTLWMIFTYWIFYIVFCWKPQFLCFPFSLKHMKGWKVIALMPIAAIAITCRYIDKKIMILAKKLTGKRYW